MKTKIFASLCVAAGLLLTACDKQKNGDKAMASDNTEKTEAATPNTAAAPIEAAPTTTSTTTSADLKGIPSIRSAWAGKPIKVNGGATPGIKEFAVAFCQAYPQFDTNIAVKNYLSGATTQTSVVDAEYSPRNGYIHYRVCPTEYCDYADMCYWNRKNGHKLFAAFIKEEYESQDPDLLVAFYDYDPSTDMMTPEPALTTMVEQRASSYDTYEVVLPKEGKDIVLTVYTIDKENDSATGKDLKLRWNGTAFD